MALTMYLTTAPRYKNTTGKEIQLIESYFNWQHEKEIGSKYAVDTFEKWCGYSENELPDKDVMDYYKMFWKSGSLFKQVARLVKINQVFNWFIKNVMNNKVDQEYYKVSKEHLEALMSICKNVKNSFTFLQKNKYNEDEYAVDENVAKELLPLMDKRGNFFGVSEYNSLYASQIIEVVDILDDILKTIDFDKEIVYFNAIW